VRDVPVELGVLLGLEDGVQDRELRNFLALEALLVVQDLPIAVAQDVRRVPPCKTKHPGLQARGDDRLHQGLAGLEVLACHGDAPVVRQVHEGGDVDGERWGAVRVGDALLQGSVSVDHRGRDRRV